jgi:stage II sporulation protein AA (anti-sigma F factor antagonist)
MKITTNYSSGRLVIHMSGELDHHGARPAMRTIDDLIDEYLPRDTVLDMSNLTFMDSSGIGVIMGRYKNIQRLNGSAAIIRPNTQIDRIIEMSGMYKIMKRYQDINEAVGAFQQ